MNESGTQLSIVLPCYNPPLGWAGVVLEAIDSIEKNIGQELELIIVNDGSSRNAGKEDFDLIIAHHKDTRVIEHVENKGKGQALRTGVSEAKGSIIIFTDIDFPYTEKSFLDVYKILQSGVQVVLGHRNKDYYQHTPTGRKIISKILRFSLKSLLRLPTDDSQCGIKGFNREGREIFLKTTIDRFLFDLEFIKLVAKRKLTVQNVDVQLKPNVVFSKVNIKILAKESANFIKILFRA
jgi:glycosyltransferase involved in cell wall biosynthesis